MIDPKLEEYAENHTSPEDEVLYELNRKTHLEVLRPNMLSGHLQGRFLQMISEMIRPQRILEIGTYTGYSTICLARGLKAGGTITTIDNNAELETMIRYYIKKAGLSAATDLRIGEAADILKTLEGPFDLAFIDADKENYLNYYSLAKEKVVSGGYILVDNVLWYGKVVEETAAGDRETEAIKAFNEVVQQDEEVENMLLPLRDGLMLIRKKT
jgi:predicted O-methyltransferase YrrM